MGRTSRHPFKDTMLYDEGSQGYSKWLKKYIIRVNKLIEL